MSEVNDNTYTVMNNPLLQDSTVMAAAVGNIQDVLETMESYIPTEVNTFCDWSYDAGDIVTVVKDAVDYVMPIFTSTLNWNGGSDVTWASSGKEEREIPDAPQRQRYGYGTAIQGVETDLDETKTAFHTYEEQTDTYIRLIATEEDIEEAQLVSKSLFQITSGEILSVVAQSGVTSTLPEFDRTQAYAVGDQVQYQGVWLEFVQPHAANTDLVWTEVKTVKTQETRITENSTGVESLVTKTGIGSLGQNETLYSKITQNADAISLVVTSTTGESGVTHTIDTASIVLAINGGTGHSSAYIEADQITLNGTTKITGTVTIDGTDYYGLKVSAIEADGVDCKYLYLDNSSGEMGVSCDAYFYKDVFLANDGGTVIVGDGDGNGSITGPLAAFNTVRFSSGQNNYDLSASNVPNMVMNASVASNVLTLTKLDGTTVNFSKATSLDGGWSGRRYTVQAKQTNLNTTTGQYETTTVGTKTGIVYDGLVPTGSVRKSSKTVYQSFIVYSDDGEGDADEIIMTKEVGINASAVYYDGWDDGYAEGASSASTDVSSVEVRDEYFTVSGSTVGIPVRVTLDNGTTWNGRLYVKVNVTNYNTSTHEYNVYVYSSDYSSYSAAYPYYGNYTFTPSSAFNDVDIGVSVSSDGSMSGITTNDIHVGHNKVVTVTSNRKGYTWKQAFIAKT